MKSLTTGRGARLVAVAVAGGTVITAAGSASAAPRRAHAAAGTTTGSAESDVVSVSLKTPLDQVLDSLLKLGSPITLNLVSASGNSINTTSQQDVNGRSDLASGTVADSPLLSAILKRSVVASKKAPVPAAQNLLDVPANPLGLQLTAAPQSAAVSPTALTSVARTQVATSSLGSLDSLGLSGVLDPAFSALNTAVQQLVSALAPAVNQLNNIPTVALGSIPNPLNLLLGSGPATITLPSVGGSTLVNLVNGLPATVKQLEDDLESGALISLDGVDAQEAVSPTASSTKSTAIAKLADLKLLGGLITVSGFGSNVTALANGIDPKQAGGSKATADAQLVSVTIDDGSNTALGHLLEAVVDSNGITADVLNQLDPSVSQTLTSGVDAVTSAANTLLTALGVTIKKSDVATQQTATHAEAHASGVLVEVAPPGTGLDLKVRVGATDAESNYAAPTAVALPAPHAPPAGTKAPVKRLAYTGSDLPLLGLTALLLAGSAVAVRRRRVG
ncbi:MAG TPA: hypothetical protein VHE83_04235 [Mycobacteriales bacterium]|nr:hypothetical protein [Mycobacteriales bacterium]